MPEEKWYSQGLRFTCTQCGNCCTGPPGYVWTTLEERQRIAQHLDMEVEEFTSGYARRVGIRYSLKEKRQSGNYDCVFLVEQNGKRMCRIYPVRPLQCRTWPFWNENLSSPAAWEQTALNCPGMNHGKYHDLVQIEIQRERRC